MEFVGSVEKAEAWVFVGETSLLYLHKPTSVVKGLA